MRHRQLENRVFSQLITNVTMIYAVLSMVQYQNCLVLYEWTFMGRFTITLQIKFGVGPLSRLAHIPLLFIHFLNR